MVALCKKCLAEFETPYTDGRRKFCSRVCYWGSMLGVSHGHVTSNGKTWKRSKESIEKGKANYNPKSALNLTYRIKKGVRIHGGGLKGQCAGEKHWNWKGGRTDEKHRLRRSSEWKEWRSSVFERDGFACKECGATRVYIEPHHITPIRSDVSRLFDITNGITLCRPCHLKTLWKEDEYAEKYLALTNSKVMAYCTRH